MKDLHESSTEEEEEETPWMKWWCMVRGNEFLCPVSEAFVEDPFNLWGLGKCVRYYEEALDVLLDVSHHQTFNQETIETIQ